MATRVIKKVAGKIQTSKVKKASGMPPLLKATKIIVCVEEAPGKSWQKALYSISSSLVISLRFSTKRCCIRPKCTCGPPKAVILCFKTAIRKGIWRNNFK